jgi:FMN phosphatase YigB (HAD superfamily)
MSFLSSFEAVLFDLNGTLADDFDRFGDDQDYHATYTRLGGRSLTSARLREEVDESLRQCLARYERGPWDPFPPYRAFFQVDDPRERQLLEDTVAEHELGIVTRSRLSWLRSLSTNHRLGLISDVWAPSRRLRAYLRESRLDQVMEAIVLSSEVGAVKPSRRIFETALDQLGCGPSQVVVVGDNYRRDVLGAAACGMKTVWISNAQDVPDDVRADRIIADVEALTALD